jgi:hypothetical protein
MLLMIVLPSRRFGADVIGVVCEAAPEASG